MTNLFRFIQRLALVAIALQATAAFAHDEVTLYDKNANALKPSQIEQADVETTCGSCHPEAAEALSKSVHGRANKESGDHPTCFDCHGTDAESIKPVASFSRKHKAELCMGCHADEKLMGRYGVNPDAVPSYERSFHGKALLRFGKEKAPACTNCHGAHAVAEPPIVCPTGEQEKSFNTCAQAGCHRGSNLDFRMTGANHLDIKIGKTPLLRIEELLFKLLTYGTMAGLLGMIALDLRKKVFCVDSPPKSGRAVAVLIALSFAFLVAGLVIAVLRLPGAEWGWLTALALMAVAFVLYLATKRPHAPESKLYTRFTLSQRAQHICLAASFTVLVLTGMPLRFADVGWSHYLQLLFGGFDGARIAHRIAAVVMTGTWFWHGFFLLYRWKKAGLKLSSWTMMPTKKDFIDFFDTVKFGLGLSPNRPQYDRFQFREKFDYFAVYWGMPIMVLSGLVLWFPVYFSGKLTELGFGIAYIAHSDEALLAFLAILIWHLYNTHLDPEHFPMSRVWYSGVLDESDMQREHPVEKAKLDAESGRKVPPTHKAKRAKKEK